MTSVKSNWMAASVAAFSMTVAVLNAQDANTPGVVRISDNRARVNQPASFHGHGQSVYPPQYDNCPADVCPHQHGHRGICYGCFQEQYCWKSPDYGYSPPAKYPLHRRGVEYNTMYPNQWYGLPGGGLAGGYPMVYQPTDTTQLGFYYQHVPFWQPNPNALPQRPVPAQWHIVAPPYDGNMFANQGGIPGAMGAHCPIEYQSVTPVQNGSPTPIQTAPAGAPAPVKSGPEASVPSAPQQIQTTTNSDHIRRAGN